MKVLHVIPSIAPCRGGPSTAVLAMTQALTSAGVKADIITTNDNGLGILQVTTDTMVDYLGSRVCFLPRWSPTIGALREFQYASNFSQWLNNAMGEYDGLHVHAVFSYLSTRAMMIARKSGKPYIVRPLGQLDAWSLTQKALKKSLYFHAVEKRNLEGAAAIHCTSPTEAANVQKLLPNSRVEVIPHGVEPLPTLVDARSRLREKLGLPADATILLFLSRWHRKKNIPLLIEALAQMTSEPWTLVLSGSGDAEYSEFVERAIRELGLTNRVLCPGHVQGEDKALLLQGADLFVLPSSSENFGIAVAEALVSGLPVVVTHGVDLAQIVTALDGGQVCDPYASSLRTAMLRVLKSPPDHETLKTKATQHFAWQASATFLTQLYSEVFTTSASRL